MTTGDIDAVIAGLTELEHELILGTPKGWGSWMFSVGSDLAKKGLGRKSDGSIYFDTPLAIALRARLQKQEPQIAPTSAQR